MKCSFQGRIWEVNLLKLARGQSRGRERPAGHEPHLGNLFLHWYNHLWNPKVNQTQCLFPTVLPSVDYIGHIIAHQSHGWQTEPPPSDISWMSHNFCHLSKINCLFVNAVRVLFIFPYSWRVSFTICLLIMASVSFAVASYFTQFQEYVWLHWPTTLWKHGVKKQKQTQTWCCLFSLFKQLRHHLSQE